MRQDEALPTILRLAAAHGWMHRPELDQPSYDAWERPDGMMVAVPKGSTPLLVSLVPRDQE
jgi:hypothetical protein